MIFSVNLIVFKKRNKIVFFNLQLFFIQELLGLQKKSSISFFVLLLFRICQYFFLFLWVCYLKSSNFGGDRQKEKNQKIYFPLVLVLQVLYISYISSMEIINV